jgi:hypothetical protein
MGNLGSGIPRSLWKGEAMPIRGSPNGARHPRPQVVRSRGTGGRDPSERLVVINWNDMTGRDQSESLVVISRCAHHCVLAAHRWAGKPEKPSRADNRMMRSASHHGLQRLIGRSTVPSPFRAILS